jgi:hypothetical protein
MGISIPIAGKSKFKHLKIIGTNLQRSRAESIDGPACPYKTGDQGAGPCIGLNYILMIFFLRHAIGRIPKYSENAFEKEEMLS